ncbi:MAG: MerR family DNA-binding transcriptional regulator [Pseudomonadota bacterium]
MTSLFSISDLSRELEVTPRTIRYYEEQGLLNPQRAGANRIYTQRDRARLILILRGKRLGFSLRDIAEYLDLYDVDPNQKEQINTLLSRVRARVQDLETQLETVRTTIGELREIERMAVAALDQTANDAAPRQ